MGPFIQAKSTPIQGSSSDYQQIAHSKNHEVSRIPVLTSYPNRIHSLSDANISSENALSPVTTLRIVSTESNHDDHSKTDDTPQKSPMQTALNPKTNICRDLGTTVHQSSEQAIPDIVEALPASTSMQRPTSTKKSWTRTACTKCVEAMHDSTHQKIFGTMYQGKAHNCRQKQCRQMLSALWKANFVRSENCHHSDRDTLSGEASAVSKLSTLHDKSQTKESSTLSQNKISKPKYEADRTSRGKFTKRNKRQSDSRMPERFASSIESAGTLCKRKPSNHSEVTPAEVQEYSVISKPEVLRRFSAFNMDILDTYPDRLIPEDFVEKQWLLLERDISAYDKFVRGVTSNVEIRCKLEVLDTVTPLSQLQEISQEPESPGELLQQQTPLLLALKRMFNVPAHTNFLSGTSYLNGQIRRLNFSYVLRAVLAYILHQQVFSVEDDAHIWKTMKRCLTSSKLFRNLLGLYADRKTVYGEHDGSASLQYSRLEILKLDAVKASHERRAHKLAESIYYTLLPLSHWMEDSPKNDRAKHLELLEKITHQSQYLANDLQARGGTFEFFWPRYGELFDPEFYTVDNSQVDDVQSMDYETKKRQLIAFTLMPVVQRKLPNEEVALPYARGVVLLKKPYVDNNW